MHETLTFGQWLRQRRKDLHLTQEDLAERMVCSSAMVRKIEAGERVASQQMAERLADFFAIDPDERPSFVKFAQGHTAGTLPRSLEQTLHPTAASLHPTNLAAPLTSLIGREQDMERLRVLLLRADERLITLTGPPGIGKTRLSLQIGTEVLEHFEDGVFFVGLATVTDPDLVLSAIAQALGLPNKGTESLLSQLQQALVAKRMLLVLDNFEQVLDASPDILGLLGACPGLKVMVTSREALHVQGEQQFPVPSLATTDRRNAPSADVVMNTPASALFVERARAVKPDFALTEGNAGAVAAICTRLEGLPLAIELAAARIRLFSPQEIQARLDGHDARQNLTILTGGARNLPARQQTLRNAIEWSYNLLHGPEQRLFSRLGVFSGGATFEAIEKICNAHEDLGIDVLDGVDSLVSKNLLKQDEVGAAESRFSMLEMLRDYALERLQANGEEEDLRYLHAEYFVSFAEAREQALLGAHQDEWLRRFGEEQDNFKAALRWLLDTGNATSALRLAGGVRYFWYIRGHHKEGKRWLHEALAKGTDAPGPVRAKALRTMALMAQQESDHGQAQEWGEQSLALYREGGDVDGMAGALQTMAMSATHNGDLARAIALAEEALALSIDSTLQYQSIRLGYVVASALWYKGDFVQAQDIVSKMVAISRDLEMEESLAAGLNLLGLMSHYGGRYAEAEAHYSECLSVAQKVDAKQQTAHATINMAALLLLQGDPERAAPFAAESFGMFIEMGDKGGISEGLEETAWLACYSGQPERAACLFGAARALREQNSLFLPDFVESIYEGVLSSIKEEIGEEAFTAAWEKGQLMSMDQAIAFALGETSSHALKHVS